MRLTARQLNRATLGRQLLLHREPLPVADAVRRIVAIQAQEPASPYLSLWARVAGFDPAEMDAAFADHDIVKASLVRVTLHAVHVDDYPAFHRAMVSTLRGSRLWDRRFVPSGLTIPDADALLPELLEFLRTPRSKPELEAELSRRIGPGGPVAWWAFRTFAPLFHVPIGGPWSFGPRPAYVAAGGSLPEDERDASVRRLVRRYLEGFGPATIKDLAQFTLLRVSVVREAVRGLADELVTLEGPDGSELHDVPAGLIPPDDEPAPPRLLPMWDSVLLAYADRSRIIPPDVRRLVIRANGDTLPTILVDGQVAGVWRPVAGGIEATAFRPLADEAWRDLADEAAALVAFLAGRDPEVYRRYNRWWSSLPASEVRVLGS